jgi:valyl-tRNA synthetase
MRPLSIPAIAAVKEGKIRFYPKRWTKVYLNWMDNIQDWCISRQIWWGHRIPVYYCRKCKDSSAEQKEGRIPGVIVAREMPANCPDCGGNDIYQDNDVLDTWFSSWLWPFATLGWPKKTHIDARGQSHDVDKELAYFYPTSSLTTAPEIIFFWVARMIMAGFEFMGRRPFSDVYIHGTVRDIKGRKMSKSLGNSIDPLEIINEYGTDALRFSLISITSQGQDVYLSKERFEQGRNFANKIWNASRFVLMNMEDGSIGKTDICAYFKKEKLSLANRWILSRLYTTLREVNKLLESYRFNEAANAMYRFFWHEFCDWYLEMIKPVIGEPQYQLVLYKVIEKFLRMVHPYMPFITEEIWHQLKPGEGYIMAAQWPRVQEQIIDKKLEKKMELCIETITAIRNMRAELEIAPAQQINCAISSETKLSRSTIEEMLPTITYLAKVGKLDITEKSANTGSCVSSVVKDLHITIPLEGVIDVGKEKKKIEGKIAKTRQDIKSKEAMLSNKSFIERAPEEIVEKEREKLAQFKETLIKLEGVRNALQ